MRTPLPPQKFKKIRIVSLNRRNVGLTTLLLGLGLNTLCNFSPWIYEKFYLNGLFQLIRIVHDYTLGMLPIPSIYLIAPFFFYYFFRGHCGSVKLFLVALVTCLTWTIALFYLLWGINYTQPSLIETLELTSAHIDSTYIKETFLQQTDLVSALAVENINYPSNKTIENEIRDQQENLLSQWGVPTIGRVRIRKLPAGSLLRLRTSGIYIPHAFEGHIDGGLYYKQHPFTIAHEMAHGYGYGDESVCNFVAYLTCIESKYPPVVYSAELAYWRYLARYYAYHYPEEWKDLELSPALRADLKAIREHISRYKDIMPIMRDVIYDKYLKSHGVKAGIKSYDQMIELIAAYRQKEYSEGN